MDISIYTGPYDEEIKRDGYFRLKHPGIVVLNKYASSTREGHLSFDERVTLVASDLAFGDRKYPVSTSGDEDTNPSGYGFWPFICRLDPDEARKLRDALDQILDSIGKEQLFLEIGNRSL